VIDDRLDRANLSLDGLSIGDAFGQRFFFSWVVETATDTSLPDAPWHFTDDTEMALAIVGVLKEYGTINQDALARAFVERFMANPARGYGEGAIRLLQQMSKGADWRAESVSLFHGEGSYGNGGAMRASPLGAWFADDVEMLIQQARLSAEVTHSHPEAQDGAVAVALAAAWACQYYLDPRPAKNMIPWIIEHLPKGHVRDHLERAASFSLDEWEFDVANELGSGHRVSAVDTVPFSLWVSAAHISDFRKALWTAARVGGDVDTTCAIIGGIVSLAVGADQIPDSWRAAREPLR
jgi:ADP-ribosylglycohydrolase